MVTLVVGGVGQGKLDYVLKTTGWTVDAVTENPQELGNGKTILNHLEGWIRKVLEAGGDPWEELRQVLETHREVYIICDEVGCGVVPMEKFDRLWREAVGRTCCALAKDADKVVRLFCGLPTILKGVG